MVLMWLQRCQLMFFSVPKAVVQSVLPLHWTEGRSSRARACALFFSWSAANIIPPRWMESTRLCDTHVSSTCWMDAGAAPGRKQHMLPPGAQSPAPVLASCSSWLQLTLPSPCSLLQQNAHPRTKTRLFPPGGHCASHLQLSIGRSCWAAVQDTSRMLLHRLS